VSSNTYFSSSGTQIVVTPRGAEDSLPGRDAVRIWLDVSVENGPNSVVPVVYATPDLLAGDLQARDLPSFSMMKGDLGTLRVLQAIETVPELNLGSGAALEVGESEIKSLLGRPKASDREVRRYIARKAHAIFARTHLENATVFEQIDFLILGGNKIDVLRNAQVLQQENYLSIIDRGHTTVAVVPRAPLIREVERYGSAKPDAVTDVDYSAALSAYPTLSPWKTTLLMERQRYDLAFTPIELESVFRAVAPSVEAIAKHLLKASGSKRSHASLGLIIGELQERRIGGVALWTQLNHVLKFSRDLEEHGTSLPEPVLRIACANAFELVPQLASLLPQSV
jgi:hypothetical protein